MPVLDTQKPRKLVWGMTALAFIILIGLYYMNNQPSEVPGYNNAATPSATSTPAGQPK